MADAVKVAVRLRPFIHAYEKVEGIRCIVRMDPDTQQTIVQDPKTGIEKSFTFDFSYNSFTPLGEDGHASQQTVWDDLGVGVLENAWQGFNVSLFAYGQTGSGKSHSMMGYPGEEGIVPRACREIFTRINKGEANSDPTAEAPTYKIEASMLEIYNERVRDLFNPTQGGKQGLKVRDHPKTGPYVQDLTKLAVENYEGIATAMDAGTRARTVAATAMNATSSRAHTIFQIYLTQTTVDRNAGKATDKVSVISLIDLAGSERADRTGASGDRLKEGSAINQSLSALGNVISALADKSTKPKSRIVVPYRDSVLTHLLKNSLGGNAKTIMIAAVSPSNVNFEETMSTLRYADRAKKIKNKAVVNEDPNVKLIRGLQDEIEELRARLMAGLAEGTEGRGVQQPSDTLSPTSDSLDVDELRKKWEEEKAIEMAKLKEEMQENQRLLKESQKTWDEKLEDAAESAKVRKNLAVDRGREAEVAHIKNIHEDSQMSGVLVYFVEEGITRVGRADGSVKQDIELSGLGILKEHCTFTRNDEQVSVSPLGAAKLFVNGTRLDEATVLKHGDRMVFGNNQTYLFHLPSVEKNFSEEEKKVVEKYDWEFVQRELNETQMQKFTEGERIAREKAENAALAMQLKVKELEERMASEQKRTHKEAAEASQAERKKLMEKQRKMELELKAQIMETTLLQARKEREEVRQRMLEDEVCKMILLVSEANELAEEMLIEKVFTLKVVATHDDQHAKTSLADSSSPTRRHMETDKGALAEDIRDAIKSEVCVGVSDLGSKSAPKLWSSEKFVNRLFLMREMYNDFVDVDRDVEVLRETYTDETNPFDDPSSDAQLIGKAYVVLDALMYLINIEETPMIVNHQGQTEGKVGVSLKYDETQAEKIETELEILREKRLKAVGGNLETYDDEDEGTLREMIGRDIDIKSQIKNFSGLPSGMCAGVYAEYEFWEFQHTTKVSEKTGTILEINDQISFSVKISEEFVSFVEGGGTMCVKVFGCPVAQTAAIEKLKRNASVRVKRKRSTRNNELKGKGTKIVPMSTQFEQAQVESKNSDSESEVKFVPGTDDDDITVDASAFTPRGTMSALPPINTGTDDAGTGSQNDPAWLRKRIRDLEINVKQLNDTVFVLKEDKVRLEQQLLERDVARLVLERKLLGDVIPPGSPRTARGSGNISIDPGGGTPVVGAVRAVAGENGSGGGLSLFDE